MDNFIFNIKLFYIIIIKETNSLFLNSDIDECDGIVCPAESTCENTIGSYSCECLPGYEWKHHRCLSKLLLSFFC